MELNDPPGLVGRKTVLSGIRFQVERREYKYADGTVASRDIVIHPGAAVILPFLDADHIVMTRNFRYAAEQELWELPAGTLDEGEAPIETARRELAEETGYRCGQIEPFLEFYPSPGILNERMFSFLATDLHWVGQNLEVTEQIVVEVISLDAARQRVIERGFHDAKTVAVLATYFLRLDAAKTM